MSIEILAIIENVTLDLAERFDMDMSDAATASNVRAYAYELVWARADVSSKVLDYAAAMMTHSLENMPEEYHAGILACIDYLKYESSIDPLNVLTDDEELTVEAFSLDPHEEMSPGDEAPYDEVPYAHQCHAENDHDDAGYMVCDREAHNPFWKHALIDENGLIYAVWRGGSTEFMIYEDDDDEESDDDE